jgi:S1-C subfamily serine protease
VARGHQHAVVADTNFDPRRSLAPLVKEIGPSVVNVRAHGKTRGLDLQGVDPRMLPFFDMGPQQPQQGIGSGVILSATAWSSPTTTWSTTPRSSRSSSPTAACSTPRSSAPTR